MQIIKTKPLADWTCAKDALREMCSGFRGADGLRMDFEVVDPEQMPEAQRRLLVHTQHMTHALHAHHRKPVDLYVMEHLRDGDLYSRKIFLTRANSAHTVELGVVRLDLRYLDPGPRDEILRERTPLGAVLTQHNVLRRIEPRWYIRLGDGSDLLRWFGSRETGEHFGRLGTIYCNGEPAVEVLEIVTGVG